jgi:transcriptional regulator with XRE-family HTH domain
VVRRDEDQWEPLDSLGTSGETVAKNIRLLRKNRGLAYTELAARLKDLQRDIPTWGLRKIESGGRRVDADDLVALALALEVSPITLLIPKTNAESAPVAVTGVAGYIDAKRLWDWLIARRPLTADTADAVLEFLSRAIPVWELEKYTITESGLEPHVSTKIQQTPEDHTFDGALER